MNLLITAFEPFGEETINPSEAVVHALPDTVQNYRLYKQILPVTFRTSSKVAIEAIKCYQPDGILLFGQAGGRTAITPEQVAINLADARIPDNEGAQPRREVLEPDAPDAYFSTLPLDDMVSRLRSAALPADISYSAGTYVCNQLFFRILHYLKQTHKDCPAGFIHIPFITEQVLSKPNIPSLSLSDLSHSALLLTETLIEHLKQQHP